jgi:hypothetical protein
VLAANCVSEKEQRPIQRRPGIGYTFNMMNIVQMAPQPPHLSHPSCSPLVAGETAVYKRTMLLLSIVLTLRMPTKHYHAVGVFAFQLSIHFGLTFVWLGLFFWVAIVEADRVEEGQPSNINDDRE